MPIRSLIIGGTSGLGFSLAQESVKHNILPIIAGRTADDPVLNKAFPDGTIFWKMDLTDPNTLENLDVIHNLDIRYFFWASGIHLQKPLELVGDGEVDRMIDTHLRGPIELIRRFHKERQKPYHLVVIASTSAWKRRENETIYRTLKAAKVVFAASFAEELSRDLIGSKTTLVLPGGIKTPNFWKGNDKDISEFMDPDEVASFIWNEIRSQEKYFLPIEILRGPNGSLMPRYGITPLELPEWGTPCPRCGREAQKVGCGWFRSEPAPKQVIKCFHCDTNWYVWEIDEENVAIKMMDYETRRKAAALSTYNPVDFWNKIISEYTAP